MAAIRGAVERRLVNRDFARLWYGSAVSTVGDYVFTTTLTLWVAVKLGAGRSWAPAAVSGLLFATVLAVVFVGPIAGVWVDRWNHRRTMLGTEAVRAAIAGAMALISLVPQHDLPVGAWLGLIFALVLLLNSAGQFFTPARQVTIGRVVPGETDRARAFGVDNATGAVAGMIGPPLAAPLLFTSGVTWALALNAASFVFSFFAVRSVRPAAAEPDVPSTESADGTSGSAPSADAPAERGFWTDFKEGFAFLFRSPFVRTLLFVAVTCQAGTGALNTLDVFFVTGNLHVAPKYYGVLAFAVGTGLIVGSLLAARIVARFGAATTTASVLVLAGLVLLIYARQTTFAAGFAIVLLFEVPIAVVNTSVAPLLLAAIPQHLFGRVVSVFSTVNQGVQMLSMLVAGWLASSSFRAFHGELLGVHLGPIDTIFSVSALLITLGGVNAFITLRGVIGAAPADGGAGPEPAAG
jgi:MFS family permease